MRIRDWSSDVCSSDLWIIAETVETVQAVDLALADLRFDGAANALYHFVWNRFCDWYLELIKPVLSNVEGPLPGTADGPATGPEADETRAVAGWVLDQSLVLLHPFMHFITAEPRSETRSGGKG